MIRREMRDEHGAPRWLLISQVEHARLAGDLASAWTTPPLAARREFLAAVYHHDDGWADWEQRPEVDRESGQPLDFREMPVATALRIWRDSIGAAAEHGPLAGQAVAGHFLALLDNWSTADSPEAHAWSEEFTARRAAWIDQWRHSAAPSVNNDFAAENIPALTLRQLQFFDFLSLWICCAERTELHSFDMPWGGSLRIVPAKQHSTFALTPWPFAQDCIELTVQGKLVPARRYADEEELAAVHQETATLQFRLEPSS